MTIVAVLVQLDKEISNSERSHPVERLAVVSAELVSIQEEINVLEGTTTSKKIGIDEYGKTLHQVFVSLDIYRRPMLALENEDFIANVNRKEMHRIELNFLRIRYGELLKEKKDLLAQILRIKSLYGALQKLLDSIWSDNLKAATQLEDSLKRARSLRDALASVGARLKAAADYALEATRAMDDALPAWKLTSVGKTGWERTATCADACRLLVRARCSERAARRVLAAYAAPRAARSIRLALDYAFTDLFHDQKYRQATETFIEFKEALQLLINCIHQEVNIFINGQAVKVPSYFTALQALRRERVTIPTFCYHERLSIAGNCRMCLIEIEGNWKPQIACATPVYKDMKIRTNSKMALMAQEGVLEFLLIDHPLDCPICDQGGECDLQDLTMRFGNDRSRFTDIFFQGKRAVENKNLSSLIRTEMTRCIHCTRCIRFASQVCGMDVLGTTGRGGEMLVGTYVDKMFFSELSGNIIDLCPVGALTSIPYMFKARPWELKKTNSIDITDATGTNVVLDHRFDRVLRVLPRENGEVNQEWLSDKGRWAIDSLDMQRLVTPMCRMDESLCPIDWNVALKMASKLIKRTKPHKIMAIAGPHSNVETLVATKDFLNMLGCENTFVERSLCYTASDADLRIAYSLNVNMKDIAKADKILLVGTNPRFEAPILNAWIRQAYVYNECDIYVVGPECEYNYHVKYLGSEVNSVAQAGEVLKGAKRPLVFIGVAQLGTSYGSGMISLLSNMTSEMNTSPDWTVLNIVTLEASFAGALEVGWKPGALAALKEINPLLIISLGADEVFYDWAPSTNCTVMYIGYQGDRGSESATLVLPGSAHSEAGGIYLNMEGRVQYATPAVTPPGQARHDWKIIRALAEYSGICLIYSDIDSMFCRLAQISPNFLHFDKYQSKLFPDLVPSMVDNCSGTNGCIDVKMKTMRDYFCSDVFTYNSPTMLKAQKAVTEFNSTSQYLAI
ncbi:unnamed protein product, partial [Iphiclides podalirius]